MTTAKMQNMTDTTG